MRSPTVVLAGFAAVLPFQPPTVAVSLGDHNLRWLDIVAVGVVGWLSAVAIRHRDRLDLGRHRRLLALAAGLAWMLFLSSVFADGFVVQASMAARHLLVGLLLASIVAVLPDRSVDTKVVLSGLVAGAAVASLLGLYDAALGSDTVRQLWGGPTLWGTTERLTAPFGHANIAGAHSAIALVVAVVVFVPTRRRWSRGLAAFAALSTGLGLLATLSRGTAAAAVIVLLGAAGLAWHRRLRTVGLSSAGVAAVLVLGAALSPLWQLRIADPEPEHWFAISIDAPSTVAVGDALTVTIANDSNVDWPSSPTHVLELAEVASDRSSTIDLPSIAAGEQSTVDIRLDSSISGTIILDVLRPGVGRFSRLAGEDVTMVVVGSRESSPLPLERQNGRLIGRSTLWSAAVELAVERPLIGVGVGNFRLHYQDVIEAPGPQTSHAHSAIFEPLASWGLPASLIFFALIGSTLARAFRSAAEPFGLGLLAAISVALAANIVDWTLDTPSGGFGLWLLAGLVHRYGAS